MLGFIIALITNVYVTNAEITAINGNEIEIETEDGNVWIYETEKDYKVGEKVTIKFNKHLTEEVEDDSIIKIYKGA